VLESEARSDRIRAQHLGSCLRSANGRGKHFVLRHSDGAIHLEHVQLLVGRDLHGATRSDNCNGVVDMDKIKVAALCQGVNALTR
jgi:hypothetical protein